MPSDSELDDLLDDCEDVLDYEFHDRSLLEKALTHASIARTRLHSNERMEFLGDSVLGLVVCEALFRRFEEEAEGEMTRMKSALVSRRTCAAVTARLGLDDLLMTGKGLSARTAMPLSVKAAVFESVVGAIYLDGGLEVARQFLERVLEPDFEAVSERERSRNFKSRLQQLAQKLHGETPLYRLLDEQGPDHSKCFKVAAVVGSSSFPAAWGPNKKEAEQHAAENALASIEGRELPHPSD
jgi:ribonuclease III